MKTTTLFAALVLLSATLAFGDDVTFGSAAVSTGESWTDISTYASHVTFGGNVREQTVTRTKETTVNAVGGNGAIDAAEVAYSAATRNDVPLPVVGRRYAVSSHGNSVDVAYADGGTPSAEEIAFVRSDNAHFRQLRAYDRIFGGKTFSIGSSVQPNKNDSAELVNASDGVSVNALALTLRSVRTEDGVQIATFDVSMTVGSNVKHGRGKSAAPAPAGGMTLSLDGTLDVYVSNARPALLDVRGPVSLSMRKPNNAVIADGTGSASLRIEYQ